WCRLSAANQIGISSAYPAPLIFQPSNGASRISTSFRKKSATSLSPISRKYWLANDRPRRKEFQSWLADEIPCTEKEGAAEPHLFPLPSLLIHCLNWRDRIVPVGPRTVMTWDRFLVDKRTLDHWAAPMPRSSGLSRAIGAVNILVTEWGGNILVLLRNV